MGLAELTDRGRFINKSLLNFITIHDVVFDVGCGIGYFDLIISRAKSVIGLDIALSALKQGKKNLSKAEEELHWPNASNIDFIMGSAEALPCNSDSIDKVLCLAVLEHVLDDKKVVKEILRVLKPGGKMLIVVPIEEKFMPLSTSWISQKLGLYKRSETHLRHYTLDKIKSLLRNCEIVSTEFAPFFFASYAALFARILVKVYRFSESKTIVTSFIKSIARILLKMYDIDEKIGSAMRGWFILVVAKKKKSMCRTVI